MTLQETIDRILDVAISCEACWPYVIVHNTPNRWPNWTPEEIAEALDIDPALCCYNLNGDVRITCD